VQEVILDKDTGLPLANGTVSFFVDQDRSVPKSVYQRTENPDNTFTYTTLGNVLTLSGIGSFVDQSGNNLIPFMWPFTGLPTDTPPSTTVELYYIIVADELGVPQFTVSAWPPEVTGGCSSSNQFLNSQNIISNPQFAVINYPSPYTFTVSGNSSIQIAPDWNIVTTGSGTVTITQDAVVDPAAPGLPAFALEITSASISTLVLSQTIAMSPRILETGFASGTFIVQDLGSTGPTITMNYVPSNPANTVIPITSGIAMVGAYTQYVGTVNLADTTISTDPGSTGYVNIQLVIPVGANISLSCVQLLSVESIAVTAEYIQESTPRQIDHIYHDAYPIVPVGTIIDFAGFNAPAHYFLCDGSTISRVIYNQLYQALTLDMSATVVDTTHFTVPSVAQLGIGMWIEGPGIPANTTILGISSLTIQVSNATTSVGTISAVFYAWGVGDGSTTFTLPSLAGEVLAGAGGTLFTANDKIGVGGGASTQALILANLPPHTHTVAVPGTSGTGGGSLTMTGPYLNNGPVTLTSSNGAGTSTAFSIVQSTSITYKYIRYE
jgi:microcystin-dependent protein